LDSWCGARAWASPEEAYIKEITVSEMFRQMGFAFQGTFPPASGNLRRGQPNEEGKPNQCGAGSDQRVGKIAVSCSEPIPDLLERIYHRLSEGWSAMPYDSANRIACEAARCWASVRMNGALARSGVRIARFPVPAVRLPAL
jgi:hypothetical protein